MQAWEKKFHEFMNNSKIALMEKIGKGEWDEKVEKELKEACEEFGKK
jgi:hypothetical protein